MVRFSRQGAGLGQGITLHRDLFEVVSKDPRPLNILEKQMTTVFQMWVELATEAGKVGEGLPP